MIFFHRSVHGAQFGVSLIERDPGGETREKFCHAMGALGHHRGPEMMGAADHIGDDFGLLWIRDTRLEHADDPGGTLAKLNGLANARRISIQHVRPETMGQDKNTGSVRTIIFWPDQTSEHGAQTHHLEIAPVNDSANDFTRLAQANKCERYRREITKLTQRLDPRFEVANFRHRPSDVFLTLARGALPDINQARLVAIDQGLDEHAAHEREDGGVSANAQCQRDDHDKCKSRRFAELA